MNDDVDLTPADPSGPSTRDLVIQLVERMGRVEAALGVGESDTQPLSGRVNRLIAEVAEFKAEMVEFKAETLERLEDVDRELARLNRHDAGRYLRLDERFRALEHPEEAKR